MPPLAGHLDVCELIVKYASNKNPRRNDGITPLHNAAYKGHLEVCKLLIEIASEKNPGDNFGRTPGNIAVEYKQFEIAIFITEYLAKSKLSSQSKLGCLVTC